MMKSYQTVIKSRSELKARGPLSINNFYSIEWFLNLNQDTHKGNMASRLRSGKRRGPDTDSDTEDDGKY